jgi:flavin-dependent dehydrogenase
VRAAAPPSRHFRFALDDVAVDSDFGATEPALCLRRSTLDPWLQDTCEKAGAELRYGQRVVDLVRDGERVTGAVVQTKSGRESVYGALVVGADGPHSSIAKLTGAPEYLVSHGDRSGYYQYYEAPAHWAEPWDSMLEHRGDEIRYLFRTDGGLVLTVYVGSVAELATWGADYRSKLYDKFLASPTTREFVLGKEPVSKGAGLLKARYFYRKPIGPGFALVGDAGHFKDFVTGQGMTDAFLDAERLAAAIVDGREIAFERFWRARDVETLPLHFDALQQGRIGFNSPFMRYVFGHLRERPELAARIPQVITRTLSPYDMIPMSAMLPWMAKAALHGRFDVLKGFLAMGKNTSTEERELAKRRALLEEVERRAPAQADSAARFEQAA